MRAVWRPERCWCGAIWTHDQPSAAVSAAYEADPQLAALRLDFTPRRARWCRCCWRGGERGARAGENLARARPTGLGNNRSPSPVRRIRYDARQAGRTTLPHQPSRTPRGAPMSARQRPTYAARCSPVRVERSATRSAGCPRRRSGRPHDPRRAEVDDPVGMRHDRLVVLDDDHRLPGLHQAVQQPEQLLHVGQMQTGGRLVEDVHTALLAHVGGQLQPLALAAGERGERLAEAEVAEADVGEAVRILCAAGCGPPPRRRTSRPRPPTSRAPR